MVDGRKELKFYGGGYLEIIENGIKLATLRKPNDRYDFLPGEKVIAICEGEGEIPINIFKCETRRIVDTKLPLLLLDGFPSVDVAVETMLPFYRGITEYSEMTLITFTAADLFNSYDQTTQELLMATSQEEAIQMPELRQVFFPSLAWWLSQNRVGSNGWLDYLVGNELLSKEEITVWRQTDADAVEFILDMYKWPIDFRQLVEERHTGGYERLVLMGTEL